MKTPVKKKKKKADKVKHTVRIIVFRNVCLGAKTTKEERHDYHKIRIAVNFQKKWADN